jgi:RNA polymerase sigma-70 factor (ECF subfamily)
MGDNSEVHFDKDTRLMLKAADGDQQAYDRLYKKYFHVLVDYVRSLDVRQWSPEDIAQEALICLWHNRNEFRAASTVKTYLFRIAKNILLDEQKRIAVINAGKCRLLEHQMSDSNILLGQNPEIYWAKCAELAKKIEQAIPKLTCKQQQTIRFFYAKEMTLQQSAKEVGCSIEAFESRLRRARKRLRQILGPLKL